VKYFAIPAAILSVLLALSLWNAAALRRDIEPWRDALSEAAEASARGDWDAAARTVGTVRGAWEARHPYYHLVTAHDELDAADTLFAQAESYAAAREGAEFRAALAQLRAQLRVVAEMQALTLKNIL